MSVLAADTGNPVPTHFNPADWFLQMISVDYRTPQEAEATKARLDGIVEHCGRHNTIKAMMPPGPPCDLQTHEAGASICLQFKLLFARSWAEQLRDKNTFIIKALFNIFFSALFGLVYFQMDFDQKSLQSRTGLLFFQVMNAAFVILQL